MLDDLRAQLACYGASQMHTPIKNISLNNVTILTKNCDSIINRKKPRGNKSTPYFKELKDYSNENAHVVLAHINGFTMHNVTVIDDCSFLKRKK